MDSTCRDMFSSQSEERNFALIVENRQIWTSKQVLSMFSPVFRNMFFGNFMERNQDSVELPDKRYEDVLEFLSCMLFYPKQKLVDNENVDIILPLVDEYDVENLKFRCEPVLKRKIETCEFNDDLLQLLSKMAKYHYVDLVKICIRKVAVKVSIEKIMKYRQEFVLPDSVVIAILEAKSNRAEKSNDAHNFSSVHLFYRDCVVCERRVSVSQCKKCLFDLCDSCRKSARCPAFHERSCPNREQYPKDTGILCECCYDFDESLLSVL